MAEQTATVISPVYIVPCQDYSEADSALSELLEFSHTLDCIQPGMTVGIKANLVSAMKPEEAATTHPALLAALCKRLKEKGAGRVIIGDSPGGVYTAPFVHHVYEQAGLKKAAEAGAELNENFNQRETSYPAATVLKSFTYTSWLDECDVLINFCKLKSHGMMGMSACAKNMFGVIPGTMKPEYHFRFPNLSDFSDMLVDLDEYFASKTILCLTDGIVGMEGNGPTKGTPKFVGVLTASVSPHMADVVNAYLIRLSVDEVPTLMAARQRGLIPTLLSETEVHVFGKDDAPAQELLSPLRVTEFEQVAVRRSLVFNSKSKIAGLFCKVFLSSRPQLKPKECIACGKCASICPVKAITIEKNGKGKTGKGIAVIDRDRCIHCFCCQEFCPVGAMRVHRTPIARLLTGRTDKK